MSRKMLEKPKTVLASQSLVKEFVEMEPAPRDRPLSERRIQVYRRILKDGNFRPVTWASALCLETNCTYRVNGKHTSVMLGAQEKLPEFYVTIERWQCDTLNDVAALYATFDSNLSSRTTNDINLSFASTIPELRDMGSKYVNLTVTAASNLKWDEAELRKVPPAERAELLVERSDFVVWLKQVCGSQGTSATDPARHLLRAAVVQAMMATLDRASTRKAATEFWEQVKLESAPDRDDPTRVLARFLLRATMSKKGRTDRSVKIVGHREVFVKCLHAWNAWRKQESTALNYHAKAAVPKVEK